MPKGIRKNGTKLGFQKGHLAYDGVFKKGNITKGFTGKHHTKETLEKMSKSHMGHKVSEKTRLRFTGANNPNWNGGIRISDGYRFIRLKTHPYCSKDGYVPEHRLIVEKYLGRYLKPKEIVHHINNTPHDNHINNLMVFKNYNSHRKYHWIEDGMQKGEIIFNGKNIKNAI